MAQSVNLILISPWSPYPLFLSLLLAVVLFPFEKPGVCSIFYYPGVFGNTF